MQSSRVLAAPGIRTDVYLGWRARLASAFAAVVSQPQLWLLGVAGFGLRGGILLLTALIIVLPTPVEVRLLLGDLLGSTGFADEFWVGLAFASALTASVALGVLIVLARLELTAFCMLVERDDEPAILTRRPVFLRLVAVQVLTFVALAAAAGPMVQAAAESAHSEVIRPSSMSPIYERVLESVGPQLMALIAALFIIEMLSALTARELLARDLAWRDDVRPGTSLARAVATAVARLVRLPVRILATAVLGWAAGAALLMPGVLVIVAAWTGVRGAFLTPMSVLDVDIALGMVVMAVALAAAFALALVLGGFASAVRAALWSVDRLR